MDHLLETSKGPEIILSDTLGYSVKRLVEAARAYETLILIYEDDFSDNVLGAWAEKDRLKLNTRRIGEVLGGIEVHSFGILDFPPGSVLEIHLREVNPKSSPSEEGLRTAYKSLLNEICLISVKLYANENGRILLQ